MYWCHWLTHACSIRTSWSLFLNGLKYSLFFFLLSWCFTSMEARWPIRDGDRVGSGRQSEGSTAETARKRPERPWTAARTMEVLRRCPLAIAPSDLCTAQVLFQLPCVGRDTKTKTVALLLRNNPMRKKSNFRSLAPPPCSWSLLG